MMDSLATEQTLDAAYGAYVVCALWSSTGDDEQPLDATYGPDDLSDEAAAQMRADVTDFLEACWSADLDLGPIEPAQLGHDFWLTRNGHGAGFWDRGLGELGDRLTELSKAAGESDLYVGDDGKLYVA